MTLKQITGLAVRPCTTCRPNHYNINSAWTWLGGRSSSYFFNAPHLIFLNMGRQERHSPPQVNKTFHSSGTYICFNLLHLSSDVFPIRALYINTCKYAFRSVSFHTEEPRRGPIWKNDRFVNKIHLKSNLTRGRRARFIFRFSVVNSMHC